MLWDDLQEWAGEGGRSGEMYNYGADSRCCMTESNHNTVELKKQIYINRLLAENVIVNLTY